ncbi:MAG: molybdopterin-binding protein [Firmicutes bacterium]|nr:molybdopterin-binding protein [Bacillota bacterium]
MKVDILHIQDAKGKILCHDITKIVRGEFKGAVFRKGHVIRDEDILELRRMGKENIYVIELEPDDVHENEAGTRLGQAAAGEGVTWNEPGESRVNLFAARRGLLHVNVAALEEINDLPEVVMATLPTNTVVDAGEMLAGTKVTPLVVKEKVVAAAENTCLQAGGIIKVLPFRSTRVGLVVTGGEVYKGRIKDTFGPVLTEKIEKFGSELLRLEYAPDDAEIISMLVKGQVNDGAEMVLVSGGMSVDPDDVTPAGIRQAGAVVEKYGAPALPGAMFLLAYLGAVPILGVPACGMYFRTTILDLVLPRLFTGQRLGRKDIVALAHGGLCRACATCAYPNCSFGKGGGNNGNDGSL